MAKANFAGKRPGAEEDSIPIIVVERTATALLWRSAAPHTRRSTRVAFIFDGDTLKTRENETVRLLGINAPEIAHEEHGKPNAEPFSNEAKNRLKSLTQGREIELVVPSSVPLDRYKRTLALVFLPGGSEPVNAKLLREGLAKVLIIDDREILDVEAWEGVKAEARREKRGMWGMNPIP